MLESKRNLRNGFKGEQLISRIINGKRTMFTESHDITAKRGDLKFEIKFARLNKAKHHGTTMRWTWAHIMGASGNKKYNRLILVGEANRDILYVGQKSPTYIFFDIPYSRVHEVIRQDGLIQISTNPQTARTAEARLLFDKFMVTAKDLKERYGF